VTQGVTFHSDRGTEFRGVFSDQLDNDGIKIKLGTPHKHNTGMSSYLENANKQLQKHMRANLTLAAVNLRIEGHELSDVWDLAMAHGARQIRYELQAKALSPGDFD
jgi:hypothetical protein